MIAQIKLKSLVTIRQVFSKGSYAIGMSTTECLGLVI